MGKLTRVPAWAWHSDYASILRRFFGSRTYSKGMCLNCFYLSKIFRQLNSIFPLNINYLFGMDESLFSPIHFSILHSSDHFFQFRPTSQAKYPNPITVQLGVVLEWISFSYALRLSKSSDRPQKMNSAYIESKWNLFFWKKWRFSIMWNLSHDIGYDEVYI